MTTTVSVSVNGNHKRLVQVGSDEPVWVSGKGSPTPVSQTFNVEGEVGVTVGPEKDDAPDVADQTESDQNQSQNGSGADETDDSTEGDETND